MYPSASVLGAAALVCHAEKKSGFGVGRPGSSTYFFFNLWQIIYPLEASFSSFFKMELKASGVLTTE